METLTRHVLFEKYTDTIRLKNLCKVIEQEKQELDSWVSNMLWAPMAERSLTGFQIIVKRPTEKVKQ